MLRIELLGTLGCHLCDQAEAMIYQCLEADPVLAQAAELVLLDIADDPVLLVQYGTSIPVLRVLGEEIFWPFPPLAQLHERLKHLAGC